MTDLALAFDGPISRPDLAALLDATGKPSLLSPRATLGVSSQRPPVVSAEMRAAARILIAPLTNLTLRLWGGETAASEMNVLFPGLPAGGGGVVLNPVDSGFRVAGFVDAETILALVSPLLPPESQAPPATFEAQLDPATMSVLAACLDLLRQDIQEERVARILDKRPLPASAIDDATPLARERVATYLQAWWGISRFNQLITYVFPLTAAAEAPQSDDIDGALDRLCAAGLFSEPHPGRLTPARTLAALLSVLLGASAGFQWQRVSQIGPDDLLVVERMFVLGAGGVALEFSPTPEGLVRAVLATRRDIAEFLAGELSALPETAISPVPAASYCPHCGTALRPQWKFCGHCGAALPQGQQP